MEISLNQRRMEIGLNQCGMEIHVGLNQCGMEIGLNWRVYKTAEIVVLRSAIERVEQKCFFGYL